VSTALTTLPNGLRVVSRSMRSVETLAVGVHVDTGSRFEAEAQNGVAHMLEHMVFKGTARRSARQIAEQIEDVGGVLNAYTARDVTVFHARLLAGDMDLGLDLIADLLRAPAFDPDELVREREVVVQELGEARDTPDDIVFDHLQEAAFPGQPLGRSILGSEASIRGIEVAHLRDWLATHFVAGSTVIAAAGKVDHDALVRRVEALFGDLTPGTRPLAEPGRFVGGAVHDRRKFEQAHLTLGYAGAANEAATHHPLLLFATAAGGGMSSRLFQELREARGLAYSVYATHTPYADAGLFSVYLAAATGKAAEATALAERILAECAAGLDAPELARAKAQVKSGLLMSLESCSGQAEFLARQLLVHGRLETPADLVARIDAIGVDAVRAAATAMLAGPQARAHVGMARLKKAA
jgi:predicted Zn-dependent peptidase